jgi:glycosyltransferase involved in cell wall biosynthesis
VTDGVEIVGEVESASSFLGDLSLLLFPSPRGSGMKVKVLEALACGLPVVTSRVGAEGIASTEGIVVADDDEGAARAAISILSDDGERRQRGAAALRAYEEHHTPKVAAAAFADLYARMLESH